MNIHCVPTLPVVLFTPNAPMPTLQSLLKFAALAFLTAKETVFEEFVCMIVVNEIVSAVALLAVPFAVTEDDASTGDANADVL